MVRLAIAACALALVGCGSEPEPEPAPSSSSAPAADLTVTVSPDGSGGPARERRIECERLGAGADEPVCRNLTAEQLAPVPGDVACTAIYGGPSVARVSGTLRGRPVDERFSLEDGCQIARWERNRDLLGAPRRGP